MTRINMVDIQKAFSPDVRELNPELFEPVKTPIQSDDRFRPPKEKGSNKFGARRVKIGNLTFDSGKEARRYLVLKAQEEAGEISELTLQFEIVLLPGFVYKGEKVQPIRYTCDFAYLKDGKSVYEDVKSKATSRTTDFRIRWRLLQWQFRDDEDVVLLLTE